MLLFMVATAGAQDHQSIDFDFEEKADGVGVGLVLGEPTGLSIGVRNGDANAFQAHFGWSVSDERFHGNLDYLHNLVVFDSPEMPNLSIPVYVGVGARIRIGNTFRGPDAGFGVRIPFGVSLLPHTFAIDPFVELVPLVLLIPETAAGLEGGIGARLYF